MLRILHKKIHLCILSSYVYKFYMIDIFFQKVLKSCTCSGRPCSPGGSAPGGSDGPILQKHGSVPGKLAKNPENVGFFSKKAEKICENS